MRLQRDAPRPLLRRLEGVAQIDAPAEQLIVAVSLVHPPKGSSAAPQLDAGDNDGERKCSRESIA